MGEEVIPSTVEHAGQLELLSVADGNTKHSATVDNRLTASYGVKLYNPEIPLPSNLPNKMKNYAPQKLNTNVLNYQTLESIQRFTNRQVLLSNERNHYSLDPECP